MILSLIRKRTDATTEEKFAVNEKYPVESVKQPEDLISLEKFVFSLIHLLNMYIFIYRLIELLQNTQKNEAIKKILNPLLRKIDFVLKTRFSIENFTFQHLAQLYSMSVY